MASSSQVAQRFLIASQLRVTRSEVDNKATESLKKNKLKSRSKGDLNSAALSAGYHAKKVNQTMYGYLGDSFGHSVWRVSYKKGDYLDPINNSGKRLFSVTPDLTFTWHEVV